MSCCSKPEKQKYDENQEQGAGCCSSKQSCCSSPQKSTREIPSHISSDMTIEEILSSFPHKGQKIAQTLTSSGLHCVGCHAATWETLEAGMLSHGKSNEELVQLLEKLNALLEEKTDINTITLTPRGAAKFLEFAAEDNKSDWGMRLSEELAGCSGFEYVLDFSKEAAKDDTVFVSEGIEIHVETALLPRLLGCEIDYVDGIKGAGFKISNPNVRNACGCGNSHGYQ